MKRAALILAALALLLGGVGHAKAGAITSLFNTGVDASGTPLPDGTIGDPHYTLVSTPAGSTTDIRVRTSAGGYPVPPYLPDDSLSAWIGPNNDSSLDGPVGLYDYQTTFTVASAGTVTIVGQWSTDNEGEDILFNGVSTGNTISNPASYESWTSFSITESVTAGVNTLDFLINNDGGPTAVRVEMTGEFTAAPEPASLTMLGFGIAGLAGYGWRHRKQQVVSA